MNKQEISFYEELQCNAFPALQNVMYDGWSVRFGGGFTYRVNCANPMYPETLPAREKIEYTESLYRTPAFPCPSSSCMRAWIRRSWTPVPRCSMNGLRHRA